MREPHRSHAPIVLAAVLATGIPAFAEDGVSADKNRVWSWRRHSTGAASALGLASNGPRRAAFAEINNAVGVRGRKLRTEERDTATTHKVHRSGSRSFWETRFFAIAGAVGTARPAAATHRSRPHG